MGQEAVFENIKRSKGMSMWLKLPMAERMAAAQAVATERKINERAVEKDWWVTVVLKALLGTACGRHLLFKGGTSISKGWPIIERFSEDIDLSIDRRFYLEEQGLHYAAAENNTQLKNLRKASRRYIHEVLSVELDESIRRLGVEGFKVENVSMAPTAEGMMPIDADCDPTVVMVSYDSIFPAYEGDIVPKVKVEISCLSMSEPFEEKLIRTLIHDSFADVDEELVTMVRTVKPSRTFLEKAFLLNEEFQKDKPRSRRMSRHLYDLERLMDTEFGKEALGDTELYKAIVEHRRKFYHLGYVDYDKDYPEKIDIVPKGDVLEAFRRDYMENMVNGYIYGEAMDFETLMSRMRELQERFRMVNGDKRKYGSPKGGITDSRIYGTTEEPHRSGLTELRNNGDIGV